MWWGGSFHTNFRTNQPLAEAASPQTACSPCEHLWGRRVLGSRWTLKWVEDSSGPAAASVRGHRAHKASAGRRGAGRAAAGAGGGDTLQRAGSGQPEPGCVSTPESGPSTTPK